MGYLSKLDDAEAALDRMREFASFDDFRRDFGAFLSAVRSVIYSMELETMRRLRATDRAKVPALKAWLKAEQRAIENDDLLRWARRARDSDIHKGSNSLISGTHLPNLDLANLGPPPVPNASVQIRTTGVFWGIPAAPGRREKLVPIPVPGLVLVVGVTNPPRTHLGKELPDRTPFALAAKVAVYYSDLVDRLHLKFP